ncbi:uncharacterized protein BXZ73DRAFT_104807 [Epithele typhae]|uniref:uncharacterized protein n=1 Tax=Epithele typhae TaxID=378194 RepID=UPI0020082ADF|nr:uncharacterized protein BXZ73DRAFT_104807 [Epithele typhae]KAH9919987.1 hypothetical protein BXZ73DRAFT_104807 [Epithele typhae]
MQLALATAALLSLAHAISLPPTATFPRTYSSTSSVSRDVGESLCVYANASSLTGLDLHGVNPDATSADINIDTCLCLDTLPLFIQHDPRATFLVKAVGSDEALRRLQVALDSTALAKTCAYPAHSRPQCSRDDVCGFTCDAPYVAEGNDCVCKAPGGCRSSPPGTCKVAAKAGRLAATAAVEISTHAAAQATCKSHETVCGVPAHDSAADRFECVDVQTSPDNCGGCMIPEPFRHPHAAASQGVLGINCTAISDVDTVSCAASACVVESCLVGWAVNAERSGCLEIGEGSAVALARRGAFRADFSRVAREADIPKPKEDFFWRLPEYVREQSVKPRAL